MNLSDNQEIFYTQRKYFIIYKLGYIIVLGKILTFLKVSDTEVKEK